MLKLIYSKIALLLRYPLRHQRPGDSCVQLFWAFWSSLAWVASLAWFSPFELQIITNIIVNNEKPKIEDKFSLPFFGFAVLLRRTLRRTRRDGCSAGVTSEFTAAVVVVVSSAEGVLLVVLLSDDVFSSSHSRSFLLDFPRLFGFMLITPTFSIMTLVIFGPPRLFLSRFHPFLLQPVKLCIIIKN